MKDIAITVDYNGIVLFDPERLKNYFGGKIEDGENIYSKMIATAAGDDVVNKGIVIPILGINDSTYRLSVRTDAEISAVKSNFVLSNGMFPLKIESRLVAADLACFLEWEDETGWIALDVSKGIYAATIKGFREIKNNKVTGFGFEIILTKTNEIPEFTADLSANMQVLELPLK